MMYLWLQSIDFIVRQRGVVRTWYLKVRLNIIFAVHMCKVLLGSTFLFDPGIHMYNDIIKRKVCTIEIADSVFIVQEIT